MGALGSAALFGALLGALGKPGPWQLASGATLCGCLLVLLGPFCFPSARIPTGNWMVPRDWHRFGRATYSMLFGAALGVGFATKITTGTVYVVALMAVVTRDPLHGAIVFAAFGGARVIPLLVTGQSMAGSGRGFLRHLTWLGWSRPIPDILARIAVAFITGQTIRDWLVT